MGKELNLVELLKDAPKGTKLYSPICGECKIIKVHTDSIVVESADHLITMFNMNGTFQEGGECLLFPSKDNRDWSTFKVEEEVFKVGDHVVSKETGRVYFLTGKYKSAFHASAICSHTICDDFSIGENHLIEDYIKVEKFNPHLFKAFDRVLVRDYTGHNWYATVFSHISENEPEFYRL